MSFLLALIAQIEPEILPSWLKSLIQLGNFGLLAYLVAVVAPKMAADAVRDRNQMYETFGKWLATLQEGFEKRNSETTNRFKEAIETFKVHAALMHQETIQAVKRHDQLLIQVLRFHNQNTPPPDEDS